MKKWEFLIPVGPLNTDIPAKKSMRVPLTVLRDPHHLMQSGSAFNFNVDPDLTMHSDADPDPPSRQ